MTFTYTEDLSVDNDYVRFHTGDVVDGENFLSDEIITSLIATEGSKQKAVIAGIMHIISRLSTPNFRADWLQIDNATARKGYEDLLKQKRAELGLGLITARAVPTYRADGAAGVTDD